jgi:hypothetical protein
MIQLKPAPGGKDMEEYDYLPDAGFFSLLRILRRPTI